MIYPMVNKSQGGDKGQLRIPHSLLVLSGGLLGAQGAQLLGVHKEAELEILRPSW